MNILEKARKITTEVTSRPGNVRYTGDLAEELAKGGVTKQAVADFLTAEGYDAELVADVLNETPLTTIMHRYARDRQKFREYTTKERELRRKFPQLGNKAILKSLK